MFDRVELKRASELPAGQRLSSLEAFSQDFLSGNGYASLCQTVWNFGPPSTNPNGMPSWHFCRADRVDDLFRRYTSNRPFVLVTHNDDRNIGEACERYLDHPALVAWFGINIQVEHPKLIPIPIGIANPIWPTGDAAALSQVQQLSTSKYRLFDVSFNNAEENRVRAHCLSVTALRPARRRPFPDYLMDLSEAWFCLSPEGIGLDCYRTWEALYLRTVPIVIRSPLTEELEDIPIVALDDWSDFRESNFSSDRYHDVWGNWDPDNLSLDNFAMRMEARLRQVEPMWDTMVAEWVS